MTTHICYLFQPAQDKGSDRQDIGNHRFLLDHIIQQYINVDLEVVDIAEDADRAEEYGIISVPSIVVNGELKYAGEVPDSVELEKIIKQEIQ